MSVIQSFGLRVQILLVLFVAVVGAFALIDFAALELGMRSMERVRLRDAQATAALFASVIERTDHEELESMAHAILGQAGIIGIEVRRGSIIEFSQGQKHQGSIISAAFSGQGRVRLWVNLRDAKDRMWHSEVLFLYVSVTGGAILLLMYFMLTALIIRPVDLLTHASDRMSRGHLDINVHVKGASEIAKLASSFNEMAAQLRKDRNALELKVQELTKTTASLESAQEQLVRSTQLASVGRLSAGIAHEIGNPLAAILGLIELLQGGDLSSSEAKEFLLRIHEETERIHHIIRELLIFTRQHREEIKETGQSADLLKVVEDALSLIAPQKDLHGVKIVKKLEEVPPVKGQQSRFVQVVLNLLLNAADAVSGKGTITVLLHKLDDNVELIIEDDGPGIDPKVKDHLFEPFVTTKPSGKGTGLGLAVCHTIVTRAEGTITVEPVDTGGTRFIVRLPLTV